jgi:hypothetical protein
VYRVHGRAFAPGARFTNANVFLFERARSGSAVWPRVTGLRDGTFTFDDIPAGEYVVQVIERTLTMSRPLSLDLARLPPYLTPVLFGVQYVSVADRDVGLEVAAGGGLALRGRLTFEESSTEAPSVRLGAIGAHPDLAPHDDRTTGAGSNDALFARYISPLIPLSDGTFETQPVVGPVRIVLTGGTPNLWLKSAWVGGVDAALHPVTLTNAAIASAAEVVIAADAATLEGSIAEARTSTSTVTVLIFSADADKWFDGSQWVRRVMASRDGRFVQRGLPPGEYWVAATDSLSPDPSMSPWSSESLLADLAARARRVRLRPSQRTTIDLSLTR